MSVQPEKAGMLGVDYDYVANIKSPPELGMGTSGSLGTLSNNITGLVGYVKILISGDSKASKTGKPLGNKFFIKTQLKCTDIVTKQDVDRSVYYNNVPDGTIPFISNVAMNGQGIPGLYGLVPGILSNLNQIHPISMITNLASVGQPDCQSITMPFINSDNSSGITTGYVANDEINDMNPCWFPSGTNPVSKNKCLEGFTCLNEPQGKNSFEKTETLVDYSALPDDYLIKLYFLSIGILGLYLFFHMLIKPKK